MRRIGKRPSPGGRGYVLPSSGIRSVRRNEVASPSPRVRVSFLSEMRSMSAVLSWMGRAREAAVTGVREGRGIPSSIETLRTIESRPVTKPSGDSSYTRRVSQQGVHHWIQAGDLRRAAASLVVSYGQDVLATCIAMVRAERVAEDLLCEVFGDAFRALATFRGDSSPRTWLLSIARNRCVDYLRARRRDPWGGAFGRPSRARRARRRGSRAHRAPFQERAGIRRAGDGVRAARGHGAHACVARACAHAASARKR